jgi:hypothetical protein
MRRLAFAAAVCGTLTLAACTDQNRESPTEPSGLPSAAATTKCGAVPFPLPKLANLINKIFPKGTLRLQAVARAGVIALLWDTCNKSAAQKGVVDFVDWMNQNLIAGNLTGTDADRSQLITIMFAGVGLSSPPSTVLGPDFGIGFFDPANTDNTLVETENGTALVELEPGSFDEPTTIVVSRNPDDADLTNFGGNQFPPNFDYNAINASGDHVLDPDHPAVIAFCLLNSDFVTYPANRGIGHNPVAGAPGFPFEILDPVDLVEDRSDLGDALDCGNLAPNNSIIIGGFSQGLPGIANVAWRTARQYLAPVAQALFLPEALHAATLGTLPPPIGGKAPSLSPFKVVETPTNTLINFDVGPDGVTPVAHGTVVNTLYASQGVTFQKSGTVTSCFSTPDVYASVNHSAGSPATPPNVVTLCGPSIASDISENTFGMIQADFAAPAAQVCIDVIPVPNDGQAPDDNFGRLEAFDGSGSSLGSVSSAPTVAETLCNTAAGIRRVQFSGAGSKFAWFDNLRVYYTAPPILQ